MRILNLHIKSRQEIAKLLIESLRACVIALFVLAILKSLDNRLVFGESRINFSVYDIKVLRVG